MELLEQIPEAGLGHVEAVQPLFIIPGLLDDVQLPVLAGLMGLEAMGLEAQEGDCSPGSGIMDLLTSFAASGSSSGSSGGGSPGMAAGVWVQI
ncbi:hypothetical protein Y1Q_0013999 [Alligator mississippiensis]|uniref:Uncharacterized protein n=1 Tax=Alligator mississippiensis TaxID=8496 RepID=A0A151PDU0_ALLMI|nr:hypothetical protein Y1Q_0013999 [Alligator mississippiensis]